MCIRDSTITLVKEGSEDIELIEFRDDIGRELYEQIIEAHIDTAREFLAADFKTLLRIPGMTPQRLIEIRRLILDEFGESDYPDIAERVAIAQAQLEEERELARQHREGEVDEIDAMFDELQTESYEELDEEDGFIPEDPSKPSSEE